MAAQQVEHVGIRQSGSMKYKLVFFDRVRGKAEMIRMMFHLSGTDYKEQKIVWEDWPQAKTKMPLGQVPVLETDFGTLSQTTAIANYIATKHGFQPDNEWERAISDSMIVSMNDVMTRISFQIYAYTIYAFQESPGEAKLNELRNDIESQLNKTLDYIEQHTKKDDEGKCTNYIFGDKMLLADIALYCMLEFSEQAFPKASERSQWLKTWYNRFKKDERITQYLSQRGPSRWGT